MEPVSDDLRSFAGELADAARRVIRPYFRTALDIDAKVDDSPVTRADREAEEAMRALIEERYPEHGILGEEYGETRPDATYRWVLDPIDGTKSFILGIPVFATLIGLERDRVPILGVIDQPIVEHRVIGDGTTTTSDGEVVRVTDRDDLSTASLLTPDHRMVHRHQDGVRYEALIDAIKLYRCVGDGYAYALLATGFADVCLDPVLMTWDLSALIPVVRGAGGVITAWDGSEAVGATSAVAACPALHAKAIAILNG